KRFAFGDLVDEQSHLRLWQAVQHEQRDVRKPGPWRWEFQTECGDDQDWEILKTIHDLVEQLARGRVEPVRVFKHHHHRATSGKSIEPVQERAKEERLPLLRRHVWLGARSLSWNAKQIGKRL